MLKVAMGAAKQKVNLRVFQFGTSYVPKCYGMEVGALVQPLKMQHRGLDT